MQTLRRAAGEGKEKKEEKKERKEKRKTKGFQMSHLTAKYDYVFISAIYVLIASFLSVLDILIACGQSTERSSVLYILA